MLNQNQQVFRENEMQEVLFNVTFLRLITSQFFQSLGYASMILLPIYLSALGASQTQIGVAMSIGTVGGVLSRPLVALSLDRYGRQPVLLVGTIFLTVGVFLLSWVESFSFFLLCVRLIIGVGIGTLFSAYFTLASDWIPKARRTEGLAIFGIFGLLPLCVNPMISILGYEGKDLVLAFPYLAGLIILSYFLIFQLPEQQKSVKVPFSAYRALWSKPLRAVWWSSAFFAGWVGVYFAFATLRVQASADQNYPPMYIWFFYAGSATLLRIFGSHHLDKGRGTVFWMIPALSLYALSFLFLYWRFPYHGMVSASIAGLGHGLCFPVCSSLVVARSPQSLRGAGISTFTAIWDLSMLLSVPIVGYLADVFGLEMMMLVVFGLLPVGVMGWLFLERLGRVDLKNQ